MSTIQCPNCYRDNTNLGNFCVNCGIRLEVQNVAIGATTRTIAAANTTARFPATNILLGLVVIFLAGILYKGLTPFASSEQKIEVLSSTAIHETGPYYKAVMSSQKHVPMGERQRYARFVEREIVMNRELPRMLGPTLQLSEVNYKHSEKSPEMDYVFQGTGSFKVPDKSDLNQRLQARYCGHNEFLMHRNSFVKVNWIYWSRDGLMLHRYTSGNC